MKRPIHCWCSNFRDAVLAFDMRLARPDGVDAWLIVRIASTVRVQQVTLEGCGELRTLTYGPGHPTRQRVRLTRAEMEEMIRLKAHPLLVQVQSSRDGLAGRYTLPLHFSY